MNARPGMVKFLKRLQAEAGDDRPTPTDHNEVVAMTRELKSRKRQPWWEPSRGQSFVMGRNTLLRRPRDRS